LTVILIASNITSMRLIFFIAITIAWVTPLLLGEEEPSPTALLITSPELADSWQAYVNWKTRLGIPIRLITTAEIKAASKDDRVDMQEKIRVFVRRSIDNESVRWVILGGDSQPEGGGHVPDRDTVHQTMWGENIDIPTDIFYLSRTDWDADGDGIFGEFVDDRAAIDYPDGSVGIGRIPVRTAQDVAAYTEKIIAYDSAYPGDGFAQRMIYTCAVPAAEPKLRTSWEKVISKVWPNGTAGMFFTGRTPWDKKISGDYPLDPTNLIDLINQNKVGKFHFHGHGLGNCWVLEDDKKLSINELGQLKNEGAYPIITTVSCFTGYFDAEQDPCIAEAMLRLPNAGAIAILAPSREGKPHFTDPKWDFPLMMTQGKMDGTTETMTRFWKHAIIDQNGAGRAHTSTKADLAARAKLSANFHMAICELNFLGDPMLAVHAVPPKKIESKLPDILKPGKLELILSGLPKAAVVCVSDGETIFARGTADISGQVMLSGRVPEGGQILSIGVRCNGFNSIVRRYD